MTGTLLMVAPQRAAQTGAIYDSTQRSFCTIETESVPCAQVTAVRTAKDALSLLEAPDADFDLLLKAHEPQSGVNAGRLLGRLAQSPALRNLPVVGEWWAWAFDA